MNNIPEWMLRKTFEIQYNPNCASKFLVRLVRPGRGRIDRLPYSGHETTELTKDILGFGETLEEASREAGEAFRKVLKEQLVKDVRLCDRCHQSAYEPEMKTQWRRDNRGLFTPFGKICPVCVKDIAERKARKWGRCECCDKFVTKEVNQDGLGRRKCRRCDKMLCATCRGEVQGGPKKFVCLKCKKVSKELSGDMRIGDRVKVLLGPNRNKIGIIDRTYDSYRHYVTFDDGTKSNGWVMESNLVGEKV